MKPTGGETVSEKPSAHEMELAFGSLPPLGSAEYLDYIRDASAKNLPAEVLVRAYRQLPRGGAAARCTLDRLLRKRGEQWDYLDCLTVAARAKVRKQPHQRAEEYEDLFQDALARILAILHTDRASHAEISWAAFCWRQVSESWRKRHGRRGERLDPPHALPAADRDFLDGTDVTPPWHGTTGGAEDGWLESLVDDVVERLEDDFVRAVARAMWLVPTSPKKSGKAKADGRLPLTAQFPDRSRDQINRAVREAKVQLAAAIVATGLDSVPERFHTVLRSIGEAK